MNKRNDFICIGAAHPDYLLRMKQDYFKNRTNPINQQDNLGGVAYNIAKKLSFLNQNTILYSLNCNNKQKREIQTQGIKFKPLNYKINQSYYTSIIDKNGKMILGLANMDDYDEFINYKISKTYKEKKIILDLNLSSEAIKKIINQYTKNNYICVCGTSAHKIYKIKNHLKKIDTIILNKQESLSLTNQKTIKGSMNYLINKNKKLNIIITNGKNAVYAHIDEKEYKAYPPITIIKNENGAGDSFIAIFNYFFCLSSNPLESIKKAICGGALQASGYNNIKEKYLQKLISLSKSIKYNNS
ncbi:PfkB family carbohydrate kinase [Alphaproteobacteria bacterium]|nr:PfkB family carbohydrate kinase [Alphaproteobacteria bacterium]